MFPLLFGDFLIVAFLARVGRAHRLHTPTIRMSSSSALNPTDLVAGISSRANDSSSKSVIRPQTRQHRCWCGARFASNLLTPSVVLTLRTNPSSSRDSRIRYTVARDNEGIWARKREKTPSAVGCEVSAARTRNTAIRCPVTRMPRFRHCCSNRSHHRPISPESLTWNPTVQCG